MARESLIRELAADEVPLSHLPDTAWLTQYLDEGARAGEPIILSLGEAWLGPPEQLLEHLARAPAHTHGYQLSCYGLPKLRRAVKALVRREYRLGEVSADRYEVAVAWSGTRAVMGDFARLVKEARKVSTPVAIAPAPGWDYAGVFEPLGYRCTYFPLDPARGFEPSIEALEGAVRRAESLRAGPVALIVLNPQHNPTAVNWSESFVEHAIRLAMDRSAAVLIDDAYYSLHRRPPEPTSALEILLSLGVAGRRRDIRWLVVKSLGKTYRCNGWGLGALVGRPDVLEHLVAHYRPAREYNLNGAVQHAMAEWLSDPAASTYVERRRASISRNATTAVKWLIEEMKVPPSRVHTGPAAPYVLLDIAPVYGDQDSGVDQFRRNCFFGTGVMLAPAWPSPRSVSHPLRFPFARMHVDVSSSTLDEALERLSTVDFTSTIEPSPMTR